jgi:DNA-binding MurR/RpiR family transcriptional regulator
MAPKVVPPSTAEELRAAIVARHDSLSKRLQQIARYVLDEPHALAIETLSVIAERAQVQPSAIVRFAKVFGFPGASQMQRLFRDDLLQGNSALGYSERVRQFGELGGRRKLARHSDVLAEFIEGSTMALQNLQGTVTEAQLRDAVALIDKAQTVYIAAFRRAFPVAAYLAYLLHQVGKRTLFVDGVGALNALQLNSIRPADLLIAISYHPYAEETVQAAKAAVAAGAKLLSIGDSPVSPVAAIATLALQVRESEVRSFRSLAASMCLAQALVIDLAFEKSRRKDAREG